MKASDPPDRARADTQGGSLIDADRYVDLIDALSRAGASRHDDREPEAPGAHGTPTQERLAAAYAYLRRLAGVLASWLKELDGDHPFAYIVFNHVLWTPSRAFVTCLVSHRVKSAIEADSVVDLHLPGLPGIDDVLIDDHVDGTEPLRTSWLRTWHVYASRTADLASQGLTTWNELLLRFSETPRPLGVHWGENDASVPPYHSIPRLAALPEHHSPGCPLESLEREMPSLGITLPTDTAERLHHLARTLALQLADSYSRWGGDSFLSIPVRMRSHGVGSVSVLSICTTRPLPATDQIAWRAVAAEVFVPLAGDEAFATLQTRMSLDDVSPEMLQVAADRAPRLAEYLVTRHQNFERIRAFSAGVIEDWFPCQLTTTDGIDVTLGSLLLRELELPPDTRPRVIADRFHNEPTFADACIDFLDRVRGDPLTATGIIHSAFLSHFREGVTAVPGLEADWRLIHRIARWDRWVSLYDTRLGANAFRAHVSVAGANSMFAELRQQLDAHVGRGNAESQACLVTFRHGELLWAFVVNSVTTAGCDAWRTQRRGGSGSALLRAMKRIGAKEMVMTLINSDCLEQRRFTLRADEFLRNHAAVAAIADQLKSAKCRLFAAGFAVPTWAGVR